jgi:phosphotransferase system  glucose/maltose/N-acetylglucosamine-specific IIC component
MASLASEQRRTLVTAMYISAAVTVVVGIVLGVLVDPLLFAVVLLAPVDLLIARQFARAQAPPGDPAHNPYARED